jgi:hypothetical protein
VKLLSERELAEKVEVLIELRQQLYVNQEAIQSTVVALAMQMESLKEHSDLLLDYLLARCQLYEGLGNLNPE